MSLVTVKPKFQVTIPVRLRERIGLHEGDLLEAVLVEDGILLRPKDVVDRTAVAKRIDALFQAAVPDSEDRPRPEEQIMEEVLLEVAQTRAERRSARR